MGVRPPAPFPSPPFPAPVGARPHPTASTPSPGVMPARERAINLGKNYTSYKGDPEPLVPLPQGRGHREHEAGSEPCMHTSPTPQVSAPRRINLRRESFAAELTLITG